MKLILKPERKLKRDLLTAIVCAPLAHRVGEEIGGRLTVKYVEYCERCEEEGKEPKISEEVFLAGTLITCSLVGMLMGQAAHIVVASALDS